MLVINSRIRIPRGEFQFTFARSGGPGGQNVNKVSSKAVLRWAVAASPSLPDDVKARLLARLSLTVTGDLVLTGQRYRDQGRNVEDCLEKVSALILQAVAVPKKRKPTRPSRGAKERRLATKQRRSVTKSGRRGPKDE